MNMQLFSLFSHRLFVPFVATSTETHTTYNELFNFTIPSLFLLLPLLLLSSLYSPRLLLRRRYIVVFVCSSSYEDCVRYTCTILQSE